MYTVLIEKEAKKQLENIPAKDLDKILQLIKELANNPRPHGCKKLKNRSGYRIRQGNYRVIYEIKDRELLVLVFASGNRKDIYD
ncbi:MAG: type II toxin-antitoxin system RelE/ParE family toxin [Bacteroidia bacterium]